MAHKFQKRCSTIGPSPGFLQLCPVFLTFCWGVRGLPDAPAFTKEDVWNLAICKKNMGRYDEALPMLQQALGNFSCTNRTIQTLGAQALHGDLQAMYKGGEMGRDR